jgi:Ser/Thr protein kinase RdoA (MazF antagonist)
MKVFDAKPTEGDANSLPERPSPNSSCVRSLLNPGRRLQRYGRSRAKRYVTAARQTGIIIRVPPYALCPSLVGAWGLQASGVEYPTAGTMNEMAVVTTRCRKVVLRGHRQRDRRRVDFEHEVMAFARSRGVPVPEAIATPDGELVVEHDGRWYSLFEHATGHQIPRHDLDEHHAAAMGHALAGLHTALLCFPTAAAPRARRRYSYQATLHRIEELLVYVDEIEDPGEQDLWAVERLQSRAEWLRDRPDPPAVVLDAEQVVHGDYQDTNLFFDSGVVSSIIDWDKAEVRSPGEEVVRAMHLSLQLDPALCRVFLAGYRSAAVLSDDQLDQAATVYSHGRASDLWLFETIYLDGDDRPRRYLTPGRFTPFLDQWEPVRAALR